MTNKQSKIDKLISTSERYAHHLNFAFTIAVFAAMIFYVSLNLFKGNLNAFDIIMSLMGITGLAMWTGILGKLSIQEEAKHKAQLRGDSDGN
ncbi:hypothetical protein [Pseudomonas fluorescens]|uniref:hypothetical protein n=1 Tax=Pseudomonas fluorescens TaxID=294 RepID=UPI00058A6CA1|nr:hypothetical protein [Pseudomonas fluorescens]CEL31176.1 hypothetical protein SRM1_04540 [Pseudomonas fluorescens]